MGKYNMHLLGWKAFEDLCGLISQRVFGATYTPFSEGKDGGRDGYFEGVCKDRTISTSDIDGRFMFQCKHSAKINKSLSMSIIKAELPKVENFVRDHGIKHYIIFTNCNVSSSIELEISKYFLQIQGLESCRVLGNEWIELTIDNNPILRQHVPRLYGIGDLTEILDERVRRQSIEVLDVLKENVKTFVSTSAYQSAVNAIETEGFVVLLGAPAVGKSTIAANICTTKIIENKSKEVLILESADKFLEHWNPNEPNKVFWFDDVFGATSLDHESVDLWSRAFPKLKAAIQKGASVIFTSRDYIFNEAKNKIKESSFPLLFDNQVVIKVSDISNGEKKQILYNHVKSGDLPMDIKTLLKPYLNKTVGNPNFTPELARRLGNIAFHKNLVINPQGIERFFSHPVEFFREVIRTLDDNKKAALVLILLHGNALVSPVKPESLSGYFTNHFGVNVSDINRALNSLNGSLVKFSALTGERLWSFYHPSMIDSLQEILGENYESVELFLLGANLGAIIRNTSCIPTREHKIFLSKDLWTLLGERLIEKIHGNMKNMICLFLNNEASDEFLSWFSTEYANVFSDLMIPYYDDFYSPCYLLAERAINLRIISEEARIRLVERIHEIAKDMCDMSFMENPSIKTILREKEFESIVNGFIMNGVDRFKDEFYNLEYNISDNDPEEFFQSWFDSLEIFKDVLIQKEFPDVITKINEIKFWAEEKINEMVYEMEDRKSRRGSYSKLTSSDDIKLDYDIFSDVDE